LIDFTQTDILGQRHGGLSLAASGLSHASLQAQDFSQLLSHPRFGPDDNLSLDLSGGLGCPFGCLKLGCPLLLRSLVLGLMLFNAPCDLGGDGRENGLNRYAHY
jgi:hypothetical protein